VSKKLGKHFQPKNSALEPGFEQMQQSSNEIQIEEVFDTVLCHNTRYL